MPAIGNIKSELQRYIPTVGKWIMVRTRTLSVSSYSLTWNAIFSPQNTLFLYPTPMGALTQLYAGTMPEALNHNGEVRHGQLVWGSPSEKELMKYYITLLIYSS